MYAFSAIIVGPFTAAICLAAKTRLATKLMVIRKGGKSSTGRIGNAEWWHPNCSFGTAIIVATGEDHTLFLSCRGEGWKQKQ